MASHGPAPAASHRLATGYSYGLHSYGPGAEWGIAQAGDGRLSTAADCPYGVLPWELQLDAEGGVAAFTFQQDVYRQHVESPYYPAIDLGV